MNNTNIKGTENNPLSATEEDLKTPGLVGLPGMTHDSCHQQMIHELGGKNRNEEAGRQREFLFSHCRELSIHLKGNQWICEHGRFHLNLTPVLSRGPKSRALTLLFPARCFSLWHKPFMARETGASSQKCIKRSTVTFQRAKACQPLTVLPFVLHLSNGILWPSHSRPLLLVADATHLKKILAQSFLIFSGPLSLLLLSLKWAQIDKMESFLLGTDFGNQRTLGKPGPHLLPLPCSWACKVPRRKFVSPAVLWHFYCLIIPLYGNLHRYGPAANETNRHKMLRIS